MYFYKTSEQLEHLKKLYDNGELKPTPKENLVIDPRVAYHVTEKEIHDSLPLSWLAKSDTKAAYGELSKLSKEDPVKNLNWDFLFFTDSDVFRPAAISFLKSKDAVAGTGIQPSYTSNIKGTKAWDKFWAEEFRRITHGYEPVVNGKPCGIRIPGEYYFYLNYVEIKKIKVMPDGTTRDVWEFPDFLTMDYYYFKELEARENPNLYNLEPTYRKSLVVAKSRRKGFSFKAAAGCVWITAFNNGARVGIASEANSNDATDAVKCARKCIRVIDHLSNFTPFGRKNPGDPKLNGGWTHMKMKDTDSYFSFTFGLENTKTRQKRGRQSTIFTMSLSKDDAASGEGLNRLYIEEAGKVANLDKVWTFSRETMKAGELYRGIAIIFGTGGEMVSTSGRDGSSKPFSAMFYNPEAADVAGFENVYEYKPVPESKKCGYFVCDMWSNFGAYVTISGTRYWSIDKMGNAFFWVAELHLNKKRFEKAPPKGKQSDYNKYLTQRCKTPSEAFLVSTSSIFNTADLIARKNEIKMSKGGFGKFRVPGELIERSNGDIDFKPDLQGKLEPITSMDYDNSNREGCLLLYEAPRYVHGTIPDDAYIVSVDTIGKNNSGGSSLNAVVVMKTPKYSQYIGEEKIVATYVGRKSERPLDYLHRLLLKLSKYYNAKISFENDQDGGILSYFAYKNELKRLMPMPTMVTKKHLPTSKTLIREFGHSMATDRHKAFGEQYLNEWLDYRHPSRKAYDEAKQEVIDIPGKRNLDLLEDELIIDQLITYNREGNFDAVMALMGAIVQFQERFNPEGDFFTNNSHLEKMNKQLKSYYADKHREAEIY